MIQIENKFNIELITDSNHECVNSFSSYRRDHNQQIGNYPLTGQYVEVISKEGVSVYRIRKIGTYNVRLEYSEDFPCNHYNHRVPISFIIAYSFVIKSDRMDFEDVLRFLKTTKYKTAFEKQNSHVSGGL